MLEWKSHYFVSVLQIIILTFLFSPDPEPSTTTGATIQHRHNHTPQHDDGDKSTSHTTPQHDGGDKSTSHTPPPRGPDGTGPPHSKNFLQLIEKKLQRPCFRDMLFLTPLSTIFQLYRGSQFYWLRELPTCRKFLTSFIT